MFRASTIAVLCLTLWFCHTTTADSRLIPYAKHPELDACLDPETGEVFQKGEPAQPKGKCEQATCSNSYSLEYKGCGRIIDYDISRCILTGIDMRHSWPLCCPNIYCHDGGYTLFKKELADSKYPKPEKLT